MKGISPIVASVLLIAITMTIAGVLAFWAQGFASKSLPIENETTSQCRLAQFEFRNCKYNSTSQTLVFSLENMRTVSLNSMTAFVEYQNGTIASGVDLNQSLPANKIVGYSVSGVSSDFSNLVIKTNCPELSRSNTCPR